MTETFTFQAETRQLLDILIHSLYTEREIFLRELISNASDALHRIQFEQLTNSEVLDPEAALAIRITVDEEARTLTISDSGIGLTQEEMVQNLGTIARSGAKEFMQAVQENGGLRPQDIIGQFGVGFYSVFMVADRVRVVSRSFRPDAAACAWESSGDTSFTIEAAEREQRGTDIIVHLKEDADEFLRPARLKEIIRRHSDYVAFPVYVGEDEEPSNKRQAIWRQSSQELGDEDYESFYRMLTLDFGQPLHRTHIHADVPLQYYALLFVPSSSKPNMFSPRREAGLKLYARKVLIQEYCRDLLPEYLSFVQGVVDSEDLSLNVSRETVRANQVMAALKKAITGRLLSDFKRLLQKEPEQYAAFYHEFGRYIKHGVISVPEDREKLEPLLLFHSTQGDDAQALHTLDVYIERMVEGQEDIYYVMADDLASASRSPHLDAFRQRGVEVLYLVDPIDAALLLGLDAYRGHALRSVDDASIDLSSVGQVVDAAPQPEALDDKGLAALIEHFKGVLGERVQDVRASKTLVGSPARLVSDDSSGGRQMFRIDRLLDRDYELPIKTLEINPRHPLMHNLSALLGQDASNPLIGVVTEQIFETALLQDGIHPDPAAMAGRLHLLMQAATGGGAAPAAKAKSSPRKKPAAKTASSKKPAAKTESTGRKKPAAGARSGGRKKADKTDET